MTPCREPDCRRAHHARGLCNHHYTVLLRSGSFRSNLRVLRGNPEADALVAEFLFVLKENPGISGKAVCEKMNVPMRTVSHHLKRRGLGLRGVPSSFPNNNYSELLDDYYSLKDSGWAIGEIAARLDVSERTIYRALRKERQEWVV